MPLPMIVAHRGASAYKIGNTLAAFQLAIQQQADYIELDVHLSGDNRVVIHNEWKIPVANTNIALRELTFAEIKYNIALSRADKDLPEKTVLALDELCDWLKTVNVGLVVELKASPISYPDLAQKVIKILESNSLLERTYIASFDHTLITGLKKESPKVRTGILYVAKLANLRETIHFIDVDWIEMPIEYLSQEVVDIAHGENTKVCSWSTNNIEDVDHLYHLGVDMITTDQPDKIKKRVHAYFQDESSPLKEV